VCSSYAGSGWTPTIEMLEADRGELLTFALVAARKVAE
jgi:hypothetical protein